MIELISSKNTENITNEEDGAIFLIGKINEIIKFCNGLDSVIKVDEKIDEKSPSDNK